MVSRHFVLSMRALVALTLSAAATEASAFEVEDLIEQSLDPTRTYYTTTSTGFYLHFTPETEHIAHRILPRLDRMRTKVGELLGSKPHQTTHIVLSDRSDRPHIFTLLTPHSQIFLDVALPPQSVGLNDFTDWHLWVLSHEYAHTTQLSQMSAPYRPGLANLVGPWIAPHQTTPLWFKEGLAVWVESQANVYGRGQSSHYRMMLRTAVASGTLRDPNFLTLGRMGNRDAKSWPWTLRPYLFGYEMIKTLERHFPGTIPPLLERIGGSSHFSLSRPLAEVVPGLDVARWFSLMLEDVEATARVELELLRRRPQTELEMMTNEGFYYSGLEIDPKGLWLVATRESPHEDQAIVRFDLKAFPHPKDVVGTRSAGFQSSFSASSRFLVFDQLTRQGHYNLTNELFVYDMKLGVVVSGSRALHGREPDVHPDGLHIGYIYNDHGKDRLVQVDTGWRTATELLANPKGRRISTPRFGPDGRRLAFVFHDDQTGGEDLCVIADGVPYVVIADGHRNLHPTWSSDGRYLVFSSDRTGVFNLYAYDTVESTLFQMTHVEGGLFSPALHPSEPWVYVSAYGAQGYDIARLRWDPTQWIHRGDLQPSLLEPSSTQPKAAPISRESYSPWPHMWPQTVTPSVVLWPETTQVGLEVSAVDPLFFHEYELAARYDTQTKNVVGGFRYYLGATTVPMTLAVDRSVFPVGNNDELRRQTGGRYTLYVPLAEDGSYFHLLPTAYFQSIETTERFLRFGLGLGMRYDTEFRQLGWSFPERGVRAEMHARYMFPGPSGEDMSMLVSGEMATHMGLGLRRTALHLSLSGGGYLLADDRVDQLFAGGALSFPFSLGSQYTLLGYGVNALSADALIVGDVHATTELADIQRGGGRSRVRLGRLSAVVRAQVGFLHDGNRVPWSVGGEIVQDVGIGFWDWRLRVGLYQGAPANGGNLRFYVWLEPWK